MLEEPQLAVRHHDLRPGVVVQVRDGDDAVAHGRRRSTAASRRPCRPTGPPRPPGSRRGRDRRRPSAGRSRATVPPGGRLPVQRRLPSPSRTCRPTRISARPSPSRSARKGAAAPTCASSGGAPPLERPVRLEGQQLGALLRDRDDLRPPVAVDVAEGRAGRGVEVERAVGEGEELPAAPTAHGAELAVRGQGGPAGRHEHHVGDAVPVEVPHRRGRHHARRRPGPLLAERPRRAGRADLARLARTARRCSSRRTRRRPRPRRRRRGGGCRGTAPTRRARPRPASTRARRARPPWPARATASAVPEGAVAVPVLEERHLERRVDRGAGEVADDRRRRSGDDEGLPVAGEPRGVDRGDREVGLPRRADERLSGVVEVVLLVRLDDAARGAPPASSADTKTGPRVVRARGRARTTSSNRPGGR